jgi:hypothetical protein
MPRWFCVEVPSFHGDSSLTRARQIAQVSDLNGQACPYLPDANRHLFTLLYMVVVEAWMTLPPRCSYVGCRSKSRTSALPMARTSLREAPDCASIAMPQ